MTALVTCIPCQYGDHEDHIHIVQTPPEGGFGGAVCPCNGECQSKEAQRERQRAYSQRYMHSVKKSVAKMGTR